MALLAVPGGIAVGGQLGALYPSVYTTQLLIFDPAALGGSGSVGYVVAGASIGLLVGAIYGGGAGIAVATALAFSWAVRLPPPAVILLGLVALVATAFGLTILEIGGSSVGGDWSSLLPLLLGSMPGAAGVILLVWLAGLRPHDYGDVLAARERASVAG